MFHRHRHAVPILVLLLVCLVALPSVVAGNKIKCDTCERKLQPGEYVFWGGKKFCDDYCKDQHVTQQKQKTPRCKACKKEVTPPASVQHNNGMTFINTGGWSGYCTECENEALAGRDPRDKHRKKKSADSSSDQASTQPSKTRASDERKGTDVSTEGEDEKGGIPLWVKIGSVLAVVLVVWKLR